MAYDPNNPFAGMTLQSSGIGGNTPQTNINQPNSSYYVAPTTKQAVGQVLGAVGSGINKVGSSLGNVFPELNISERLQALGGQLAPRPAYAADNSGGDLVQALIAKGYNPTDAQNAANGPNASNLRNEYLGGGNNGGNNTAPAPNPLLSKNYSTVNLGAASTAPGTTGGSGDVFSELFAAAEAGNQSAIDMINSQYGQNESELNRQLGLTDQYQGNDLNTLLSQFNSTNTDIGAQKLSANQTVETQTGRAADQARMTQKQNRNVLRALGILGSTYAAENLAAPINAFDKQKADIAQWGTSRLQELDNFYNQKKSEYDNLVRDVTTKYGDLKQKIMSDLRYNGQQKAEALKAATAGAQQNLANLNMQKANYEQQLQQQKQALTTQIANMLITKTPTANMNDIMNTSIAYANKLQSTSPNQQIGVYQGVSKAPQGFDMANYVGWDKNAAYQDWLSKNRA